MTERECKPLWNKFLLKINGMMNEEINIDYAVYNFKDKDITNSILGYLMQYNKISEKQYAVIESVILKKIKYEIPTYKEFLQGHKDEPTYEDTYEKPIEYKSYCLCCQTEVESKPVMQRGYTTEGKGNPNDIRYNWLMSLTHSLFYDLPLETGKTYLIEVLETKGTQSLISIGSNYFKVKAMKSGKYKYRRTTHKGFLTIK